MIRNIIIAVLLFFTGFLLIQNYELKNDLNQLKFTEENTETVTEQNAVINETENEILLTSGKLAKDFIILETPKSGEVYSSPITFTGTARGYWFFEANFPIIITNWDGLIIGEGFATAEGDWMTEDFVPFTATVEYDLPVDSYSTKGTVILKKANASGEPEFDDALEFNIELVPNSN